MSYSDKHYGEGDPKCKICGGIGWFRYDVPEGHSQFGKVHQCPCRHTDPASGGLLRAWMNPDQIAEALRITGDWWHDKPGRERQQAACNSALADIRAGTGSLLTLVGDPGTGKSSLLYWLAVQCVRLGVDTVYCDAERFKQAISPATHRDDGSLPGVDRLNTCHVALLDNLDWLRPEVSSGESYAAEMVRQIGNRRYEGRNNRKVTVWTFNMQAWQNMGGAILHTLFDRLREGTVVVDRTENFRASLGSYSDDREDD